MTHLKAEIKTQLAKKNQIRSNLQSLYYLLSLVNFLIQSQLNSTRIFGRQTLFIKLLNYLQDLMDLSFASRRKPTKYQEYRSKAKRNQSFNALFSAFNEVQQQMKAYQIMKSNKNKQSLTQSHILKEISNEKLYFKERYFTKYCQKIPEKRFVASLQTIQDLQYDSKMVIEDSNQSNHSVFNGKKAKIAYNKDLSQGANGNSRKQSQQKQELKALKQKVTELQKQLLEMFSSNYSKKKTINKQFQVILKLFV